MKKIIFIVAVLCVSFVNAQAYNGKGDNKLQLGANLQNGATGINLTYDHGFGENISLGLSTTYLLNVENLELINADFGDRVDLKLRFNANLGNVINVDENLDIYPGLSLGLHNFSGHLGARYFFSTGFGVFTEFNVPFAKYDDANTAANKLNNQFAVNIGAVFNL